jgi:hypothetical protein
MKERSWFFLAGLCQVVGVTVVATVISWDDSPSSFFYELFKFAVYVVGAICLQGGLSAFMKAIDARIAKQQSAPALGPGASSASEA